VDGRNGFSLIETMMVVVVLGMVVLIGFPKLHNGQVRSEVRSARTAVVSLLARARVAATQANRVTWVSFQGNKAMVLATKPVPVGGNTLDTLGGVADLGAAHGVTVFSTNSSISYDPRGLSSNLGGTAVIRLSRGSRTDSVRVDGLGRVLR
jgi:prepilin-type N-terminal cleavage/methylation domain-containing protein